MGPWEFDVVHSRTNHAGLERQLTSVLHLSRRPVAVAFRDMPPDGVPALTGSQPSGCSFWRLAANGQVFYTSGQIRRVSFERYKPATAEAQGLSTRTKA